MVAFDKMIRNFIRLDEKTEATLHGYLQTLSELLSIISPKTLRDQHRLQVAKEHVSNVKRHIRRIETRINELEEEKTQLLETKNKIVSAEELAMFFHETYEKLAPEFSYKTKKASAVDWKDVPKNNKDLMIAVAEKVINRFIKHENNE